MQILNRRVPRDARRLESDGKGHRIASRARADRGQKEFRRYLDEKHLPLVKRLPGLQRLVVDYAMPNVRRHRIGLRCGRRGLNRKPAGYAGPLASPQGQAVYADTPNFADVDRVALLVVQESTIVPG